MIRRFGVLSAGILAAMFGIYASAHMKDHDGRHRHAAICDRIDDERRVTLHGNTRPEANSRNDRGSVPNDFPMDHMLLLLKRAPEDEQAVTEFVDQLNDKTSPNYHQWVTATAFGQKFGVVQDDIETVTSWLGSHGFTVNIVYPSGMLIDFSGNAGEVREAFHTEIHFLDVRGAKHIANMSDPQIPAALAPVVAGIVSLHNFMPHPMYKPKIEPAYTINSNEHAIVPADLATIYNLNPLFSLGISGQSQTIVVVEDTNVVVDGTGQSADWTTFRSTFGLSGYSGTFSQTHPGANCTDPGTTSDESEAILDAEYAGASAPSAAIQLASCSNTFTFGGLIAIQNLINASSPPNVMSMSYGECEAINSSAQNAMFNTTFQQAVSEGVSVFVSSGDEGAASCDADLTTATHGIGTSGFATTVYNVAVGGTDFGDSYAASQGSTASYWNTANKSNYGSAISYVPEIPWNDSCASVLIATLEGFAETYGTAGFCNSTIATSHSAFLTTASGSGGPSGCATGTPSTNGVVSGTCAGWPKPTWQSGLFGNPSDSVRDIPDVSLFAANGVWGHYYPFCFSDSAEGGEPCTGAPSGWSGGGGTSFASPIMAGIQALVDQVHGAQGNPNTVYYTIAKAEYGASGSTACNSNNLPVPGRGSATACVFYDVTLGDMNVNCRLGGGRGATLHSCYRPTGTNGVLSTSNSAYQPAYVTGSGWDFATGIGTVNAFNLVFNSSW
jgi:subtilase family serine protease